MLLLVRRGGRVGPPRGAVWRGGVGPIGEAYGRVLEVGQPTPLRGGDLGHVGGDGE